MGAGCLADRFSHYIALTDDERAALEPAEADRRLVRRGATILEEGARSQEIYVVQKGWLQSSVLLGNGGRQIMRVCLPGDIFGLSALAYDEATETVTALTEATLCLFSRERLSALFRDHPRLAALLFAMTTAERVGLADRLASIGRTPARARVASLLCDIFTRLRLSDPDTDSVHVPLTQEEIGDATGLTSVHVNRMVRGLVDDGIIERQGNVLRLLDSQRLMDEANYTNRLALSTGWLPDPR